jgi:hypothetical protein
LQEHRGLGKPVGDRLVAGDERDVEVLSEGDILIVVVWVLGVACKALLHP